MMIICSQTDMKLNNAVKFKIRSRISDIMILFICCLFFIICKILNQFGTFKHATQYIAIIACIVVIIYVVICQVLYSSLYTIYDKLFYTPMMPEVINGTIYLNDTLWKYIEHIDVQHAHSPLLYAIKFDPNTEVNLTKDIQFMSQRISHSSLIQWMITLLGLTTITFFITVVFILSKLLSHSDIKYGTSLFIVVLLYFFIVKPAIQNKIYQLYMQDPIFKVMNNLIVQASY